MKYSLTRKRQGRHFRYNYETENLEYIEKFHGKWEPIELTAVDKEDWEQKWAREAIIDDFCSLIDDAEFDAVYNIVIGQGAMA